MQHSPLSRPIQNSTHRCKGSVSQQVLCLQHTFFSQLPADPKAPPQPPSESSSKATLSLPSLTSICPCYFPRKAHRPLLPRLQVSQGGTEDGYIPIRFRKGGFCTFPTSENKSSKLERRGRGGEVVVDFALLNTQMWLAAPTVFHIPASVVATLEGLA